MSTQEQRLYNHNPFLHLLARASCRFFKWIDTTFIGRNKLNPEIFDINPVTLTLPRLDAVFDGYRIAHISDMHTDTWLGVERLEQVVHLINAQNADLIVITGDFITYRNAALIKRMTPVLSRLHAPDGVMAVMGNHDYWSAPDDIQAMLEAAGIEQMGNRVHTIRRGAAALHIAGLDDVYNKRDELQHVMAKIPPYGAAILLVHVPDFADVAAVTGRFDLSLSGHSHGGQLVFPGLGPLILPPYGKKYYSGLYRVDGMYQYTTRGLGTSTFAVRLNCPPEISIHTLRSPLGEEKKREG